jgi:uncharacterized protein (TIGR02145 family)
MKRNLLLFISVLLLPLLLGCNPTSSNNNNVSAAPDSPALSSPNNGATNISTMPTLTWGTISGAVTYHVQVSTSSAFATTVANDSSLTVGSKTLTTGLSNSTKYYWRVNARDSVGTSLWSTVWSFTTVTFSSGPTVTDADGNVYNSVIIGTQTWTVENLKTTKYNDGTAIPLVADSATWSNLRTAGYCWYNNDATNKNTYGTLYNWYVVHKGKLAPAGWHVPSDAEWSTLQTYLVANGYNYDGTTTGNKIAKSMAAQANWYTSTYTGTIGNNLSTNNRSGFSALPGGYRDYDGYFTNVGYGGIWWSASENDVSDAFYRSLGNTSEHLYNGYFGIKSSGYSVRLMKD